MKADSADPRTIQPGDRIIPATLVGMPQPGTVATVRVAGAFVRVTFERGTGRGCPSAFRIGRDWPDVIRAT